MKRKRAKGLCTSCGQKALPHNERCLRHYTLRRFSQSGLGAPQGQALQFNREHCMKWLRARYLAIQMDGADESLEADARRCWERRKFTRLKDGADRFVRVAKSIERLALRRGK
jgi:hypothetical protein